MKHRRAGSDGAGVMELLECRRLLATGVFSSDQDIGSPALAGSASYANGTYTITAAGSDIGGDSDQFHFAYNTSSADGSLFAKVASLVNTNASAKAGVMFRSGTSPTAAFAGIFVTPTNGMTFVTRFADGTTAGQTLSFGFQAPRFVRLSRSGAQITAFHSANGLSWTQLGSAQNITLGANALVGLAVTSRNVSTLTTATFANVSLLLPSNWGDNDIGSPAVPGFATYDPGGNSFEVSGSGTDIGGTSDQFNFANHSMTGDGSVIALVDGLDGADPSATAAVMIRDDTSAGARFASVGLTAQNGLLFQWRSTPGASASSSAIASINGPVWLKLTQQDDSFSAYYSGTGINWTQIGAGQTSSMTSATTFTGLAVTSHNNAALAAATFSSVSIVQGGFAFSDVGSPSLGGSATYDAPGNTYTLIGGGADIGGTSDQFGFVRRSMSGDGTLITYVNSISNTDPSAKAGVMFRVDDTAASAFAGLFVTPQSGVIFAWRATSAAPAQQLVFGAIAAPVSLRLVRSGNTFVPSYSTDGINFIVLGPSQMVAMPATILAGIAVTSHDDGELCKANITGAGIGKSLPPGAGVYSAADELFLHDLSQRSVRFFYDETNPNTGLVPDGALANGGSNGSPSSIAAVGFGLTALTIGDQRGWLTHADAYQRALNTVNFLNTTAAQVNGFFYHFLDRVTGQRAWNSELSSIDTALLMAGVLNVAQYWSGTPLETVATNVFNRVNWPWMQKPNGQFYGEWRPESGFGVFTYADFSEAALLYLLGLGSATHPIALSSWLSWTRTPVINYAGYTFVTASTRALFTVQYPQAWYDLRGLVDSTSLNYYSNSQIATLAQRQMFIDLSSIWPQYGPNLWGATAADGPGGYTVYGGPPAANIDGTVVPTAPGGSLAFVPRRSVDALRNMQQTYGNIVYKKYGLVDAFNPHTGWTSSIVLGIDVGMMLLAAENSRSNSVWDVFKQNSVARQSLASAFPSLTPALLGAVSRKMTASGMSDLPVYLSGDLAVENRQGGPTQLVLTFGANVVKGPNFAVSLSSGAVSSSSVSGATLTINLSGTTDAQTLIVNLSDVRHNASSASGNYTFNLGVLLADANQDRSVNLNDFNILAAHFGGPAQSSADGDFNYDDMVNLIDFNLFAGQFGRTLAGAFGDGSFVTGVQTGAKPAFSADWLALGARSDDDDDTISALLDRVPDQVLV